MRRLLRPSYAIALAAVVLAMSGSAVAASKITSSQIKDSTITGRDIKNRSLTAAELTRSTVNSLKGATGPAGPAGPAGPTGPQGPSVVSKMTRVAATSVVAAGDVDSVTVACPAGMGIVTGGFQGIAADGEVFYSDTFGSTNSWSVGLDNFDSLVEGDVTAVAFCAPSGAAVISRARSSARVDAAIAKAEAAQRATHAR